MAKWITLLLWAIAGVLTLMTDFRKVKSLKVSYGVMWVALLWELFRNVLGA